MENQPNRTATIAVVAAVVALLLGLCAGAVVGGVAGYALGQSAAARSGLTNPFAEPAPSFRPGETPAPGASGVVVQSVVANSAAEQAGIRAGDIITQVDNTPVDASHSLAAILGQYRPGDTVRLTIVRGGRTQSIGVRLGASSSDAQQAYLGVRYSAVVPLPSTPSP